MKRCKVCMGRYESIQKDTPYYHMCSEEYVDNNGIRQKRTAIRDMNVHKKGNDKGKPKNDILGEDKI